MRLFLSILLFSVILTANAANLVEVASRSGQFSTLLKAAVEADLADTLSIDGPFTIFAPTDKAFAELPHGVLSELLKEKNKSQLANLLKYHVVAGSYSSNELPLLPLKTLNGQDVKFTVGSGSVFINGSQVLTADIEASNGVIHVIDKVLIPQNSAAAESAKSIIMRGIRMGVQHFNNGNHSACAEIYEITLRSLLMLPESELSKASQEMVSDSLKQIIMMESPTDKAWEARETFDKLLAINTGDSASGNPTEDTYVTMSIIDDCHMMIKWKGHDSVKLQRSSDFRSWQTIDESKGESKFMMRIGSEIEFFRTVKE